MLDSDGVIHLKKHIREEDLCNLASCTYDPLSKHIAVLRSPFSYTDYASFLQVEALAVKLTQEEGELIQEKFEVKKLANFLKQVMDC